MRLLNVAENEGERGGVRYGGTVRVGGGGGEGGHRVQRLPASNAEQRQEALAREEAAEAEAEHRVVHRGQHLTTVEARARRERASKILRAAVTSQMIQNYGDETRGNAMARAATARVPVEQLWAAEDAFTKLADGPEDLRPGNPIEAHKSRQHTAAQAAACAGRCRLCDAGRLHRNDECEMATDPAAAWRRGMVDHRLPTPAVVAECALLPLGSQSEVDRWTRETPDVAKVAMQDLILTRKGLAHMPDPAMFHGIRVLKLSRNRIAHLPAGIGDHMPCLERLEASCNILTTLPASVGTLMFLEHLDVSGNRLERLPSMRGNQSLVRLDASDNHLVSLPVDLSECASLRQLVVNGNVDLAALPDDLGLFQPELQGVWARGCGLLTLPGGLEAASGLTDLDVGSNRLRQLPPALGGAQQPLLRVLRAADNALLQLPPGLASAVALEVLDVTHNALIDVDVTMHTTRLVELRASHNNIRSLPRNMGGGPGRLRLAMRGEVAGSNPGRRNFWRGGAGRYGNGDGGSASGGLSLDESRQLSATQPINGHSLDGIRQLSITQPINGLSLDECRQLNITQPISGGGGLLLDSGPSGGLPLDSRRWSGLRVLHVAHNRLETLPADLGATLAGRHLIILNPKPHTSTLT